MTGDVLVTGAGGFLGGHLVRLLSQRATKVVAVDVKPLDDWHQRFDVHNVVVDLRNPDACARYTRGVDQVFHFAADMGGIGYIARNDWPCVTSVAVTINLLDAAARHGVRSFFFPSSACVYPPGMQSGVSSPLREEFASSADPEGGYGWSKFFSEKLCEFAMQHSGMDVRVARLFNVYGPMTDWDNERAKAPAAICRKVAHAALTGERSIMLWGDGSQRRSFLFVDDFLQALLALTQSQVEEPVNIASNEVVSVRELAGLVGEVAGLSDLVFCFDESAPTGVATRIPDSGRCERLLDWRPVTPLRQGLRITYNWVYEQMRGRDATGGSTGSRGR